jgi:hypothetical protein
MHYSRQENSNHHLCIHIHKRIIQAVNTAEFVCDTVPYVKVRGVWRYTTVLNVHANNYKKSCNESFIIYTPHLKLLKLLIYRCMAKFRNSYKMLFRKYDKKSSGRRTIPKSVSETQRSDSIKMVYNKNHYNIFVNTVMNLQF